MLSRCTTGSRRTVVGVATAVVVVCGLLGVLASRGSWYTDDLDFLIQGAKGFSPADLFTPVNDHLAPGLRLTYAVFAALGPLDYPLTVIFRCVVWAAAMVLMAGLVHRLHHRPTVTVVATVCYGLSPVVMPAFMSLSSAVNNLPSQLFSLVFLHATLDWFDRSRRRSLVVAGLAALLAVSFWELSALVILTAAALVPAVRHVPWRRWWPWLLASGGAVGVFGVIYLIHGSPSSGSLPGFGRLATLVGEGYARALGPAAIGGPWTWTLASPPYFGLARPHLAVVLVSIGVVALAALVTIRRSRRTGWLWAALAAYWLLIVVTVAYGRYRGFGDVLTSHYHYWAVAALPIALLVAATWIAVEGRLPRRVARAIGAVAVVGWLLSATVSMITFAGPWGRNVAGDYLTQLRSSIEQTEGVNLWDSTVPDNVLPAINQHRQVSDLTTLMGLKVKFQQPGIQALIVDNDGRIGPADFSTWVHGLSDPGNCNTSVRGVASQTIALSGRVPAGRWAIQVGYLGSADAGVEITAVTPSGPVVLQPASTSWPRGLNMSFLTTPNDTAPIAITVSSHTPGAVECIGEISVGTVSPAAG